MKKKKAKKTRKKPAKPAFLPETPKEKQKRRVTYPVVAWADSPRIAMLLPLLKELTRKKVISDWNINLVHGRNANVYVGRDFNIEDQLASIREDVLVTVFKRFPDGTLGEVQIPIVATSEKEARKELLEAAAICEHARKKAYSLPTAEEDIEFPEGCDMNVFAMFEEGEGIRVPLDIYAEMKEHLQGMDVTTNCFEILVSAAAVRVLNSNGIDVSYHKTSVYIELTMSHASNGEEQEFQWHTTVVSPEQLDLRPSLEQQAEIAHDAVAATPNPGFKGDILLSGQSLLEFFTPGDNHNPLILHTFGKLKLMGLSQLEAGEPIGEFQGEPFSITSNPHVPLGLLTSPVDDEGTPLKPIELIRTGIFTGHIATARYAEHLDVPLTGDISNIHVGDGATREEHLRGNNYFEIVSFSWFNPDPFSGDFSAEVRLGYHWVWGRKTPFKGGHFRGNVFKNLLHARFSREIMQEGRYYGPRAVLFKEATVTKRE